MKLVSIRTRYGGTRAVLWARNREEATCGLNNEKVGNPIRRRAGTLGVEM